MSEITCDSTLVDVATLVSTALERAGIAATLSGGGAVSIYTENVYQSYDLDFVTEAMVVDLIPALEPLGFRHTPDTRFAQFEHPLVEWYLEFPKTPLSFGNLQADHGDCATIELPIGQLRIITPTQSVMDRLTAAFAWSDPQSREQAILVATSNEIDWDVLESWFAGEGESDAEFQRFRDAVNSAREAKKA